MKNAKGASPSNAIFQVSMKPGANRLGRSSSVPTRSTICARSPRALCRCSTASLADKHVPPTDQLLMAQFPEYPDLARNPQGAGLTIAIRVASDTAGPRAYRPDGDRPRPMGRPHDRAGGLARG